MNAVVLSPEIYEVLAELAEDWFELAEENNLKFPVVFVIVGLHGQYLCGMMRTGRKAEYRVTGEYQAKSLFAEAPHHTILIDSTGQAMRLTRVVGPDGQVSSMVQ